MVQKALEVLKQYNKSEALLRHGIAVGAVMRYFAQEAGEDADYWATVGLLHDVDYELYPEEHCQRAPKLLRAAGYDEAFVHAVISHGYGIVNEVEPLLYMERVLYAADELTGLIAATALMRPSKSVMDLEVKSVKKKFKDKGFAAGVSRETILDGCGRLNMELDELIEKCILGMRAVAEEIGL